MILPQLDQSNVYLAIQPGAEGLSFSLTKPNKVNALNQSLPVFLCASDSGPKANGLRVLISSSNGLCHSTPTVDIVDEHSMFFINTARASYVGSHGFAAVPNFPNGSSGPWHGIFDRDSNVGIGDILDGSSNTMLATERSYQTPNLGCAHGGAIWAGTSLFHR